MILKHLYIFHSSEVILFVNSFIGIVWFAHILAVPSSRCHRGRHRMVDGFTTTYEIGAYHH